MTRGLSREQVIRRVYRISRVHFGRSIHGHVEVPPLSQTRDGPLSQARDGANFSISISSMLVKTVLIVLWCRDIHP
ncbi:hypothetical protein PHMEG_00022489 [Phytophthora megakarya]|uniref:Uncharacterized protein n=1 Tax=Phytophthora megakarya TaxID=4795 RepID=A0A225VIK1_9STRA|nr:hypothetical protein PHMEG_00022489 [Phytophthora megakarya]